MIHRSIQNVLLKAAQQLPVVAILGPRQSGKTTLAKAVFNKHTYISLEELDLQARALADPRGFLADYQNPHGLILDEIQNVPSLLSYIQSKVDEHPIHGYFILTGSQNFLLNQSITQTLAGRIAILTLLPLTIEELKKSNHLPRHVEQAVFMGGYPRLYAHHIDQNLWFDSYIRTYIERDVRQIINVQNLRQYQLFLKMCAGRTGQLLNLSKLANDIGITHATAKSWISLLEASYIIFLLQPHHKNFGKKVLKTPKLYFYDTGIVCHLLGIESAEQITYHYARGALVENLIIADLLKQQTNMGRTPSLYFWQDHHGNEIDCIIEKGEDLFPVEIKAGKTINPDFFKSLNYWHKLIDNNPENSYVVYGGNENQTWPQGNIITWQSTDFIFSNIMSTSNTF